MHLLLLPALLMLAAAPALSQDAPKASQTAPARMPPANSIGFTYSLPEDWEIVGPKKSETAQQKKEERKTADTEEKKGIECVEVELTARHGDPPSVVVVVGLPFDCYGETMTDQDLPGFGSGAAEGLKQTFDISNPLSASYALAGHEMWVERARATPKGKTAPGYTVEIACTLLKKGMVCWMAQAADEAGLRVFENGPVTLDGEAASALVPKDVFVKAH